MNPNTKTNVDLRALLLGFTSLFLIIFACLQLMSALHASALERSLVRYHENIERVDRSSVDNDQILLVKLLSLGVIGGYEYDLSGRVASWYAYLFPSNGNIESARRYFLNSVHRRPTWYATYIDLAKLGGTKFKNGSDIDLRELAFKFGPHMPLTIFSYFDFEFGRWNTLDSRQRIELSTRFLTLSTKWKYRQELSHVLAYSVNAHRMCQLLKFNGIAHPKCLRAALDSSDSP